MRLWTLHPRYLDAKGLVAAWREGLLAQKVLAGKTKGYRHHPQLARFRALRKPVAAVATFLAAIAEEGARRGYKFDVARIASCRFRGRIPATRGQLRHEWEHLRAKLQQRAPNLCSALDGIKAPRPHPLFRIIPGDVHDWERR